MADVHHWGLTKEEQEEADMQELRFVIVKLLVMNGWDNSANIVKAATVIETYIKEGTKTDG